MSQWLGHSSVNVTMIYAHLAPGHDPDIDKVAGRMAGRLGGKVVPIRGATGRGYPGSNRAIRS